MTIFDFPDPVNDKAARAVAAGVLLTGIATLVLSLAVSTSWLWLIAALTAGFAARVFTGPTLSPLGQLATRVIAPRLGPAKLVPGPPKRFAQGMGLTVTGVATVLLAAGYPGAAQVLLALLIVAAGLESVLGLCIGCRMFALLMRVGLIPVSACPECANISLRADQPQPSAG